MARAAFWFCAPAAVRDGPPYLTDYEARFSNSVVSPTASARFWQVDNLSMHLNAYEYLESNEQFGKFVIQVS